MRSRASFKGHPLHPALIPFPFAFLWGAVAFDIAGVVLDRASFWTTASHLVLAGIIAALVAAIPGIIDYTGSVPPRSSAKTRATKHMLANSSSVLLFTVAWLVRGDNTVPPTLGIILLESIAAVLLGIGGWMGGTLTFRNQIGVDHRYAEAGKWKETHVKVGNEQSVVVASSNELKVNQMKLVHVTGGAESRRVVLGRTEKGYVAFDDRCTHRGASLADGTLACGTVQCPWHGSQFDVASGAARAGPAKEGIVTYEVEESGDQVRLKMPSGG